MRTLDANIQEQVAQFTIENLSKNDLFALGTKDFDGNPWVVCLNLCFDDEANIIWKSLNTTEHSKYIQQNPHVSICVFNHSLEFGDFGLYIKAKAHEVTDADELAKCLDFRFTKKGKEAPSQDEFLNESPVRIYRAEVMEAWVNDSRHVKAPIDLDVLRKIARRHFAIA